MDERLRRTIDECYDGSAFVAVTGVMWKDGTPFQIFKFEEDVECEQKLFRCLIITKWVYDAADLSAVDYTEDVFTDAWEI